MWLVLRILRFWFRIYTKILLTGGPAIVCSRWDQEVRETRHQIMAAARFLMKNDMMFVAEREVEIHIWKTVYYQV